jgi:hypothetical protein
MAQIPEYLVPVIDINDEIIDFTEPKVKDGRFNAYLINTNFNDGTNLYILTDPISTSYGLSEYQENYSITVKKKSIINEESAQKFFDTVETLNGKLKDYFIKHNGLMLNKKDAAKIAKNPKLVQAYVNPCIKQDRNGEDEIKLKVRSDIKTKRPIIQSFTVEKFEIKDDKKSTLEKTKINLEECENPWSVMKDNIKPGSHIQAVVKPNIYWYGNRFGVSFNIESLMVLRTVSTTVDVNAIDLNADTVGFTPPKKGKDGKGFSALVLNSEKKSLFGKIKTGWIKLPYGISAYENKPGEFDYSIFVKNRTDISESTEDVEKFFEFSNGINDKVLDYAEEHNMTIFTSKEELSRDIIESANFNACVSEDKNGEEQIKFKIMKNDDDIPTFTCIEYDSVEDDSPKKEIDWNSFDNVWEDIKNVVRGGSHVRAIVQPRIYFTSNKIGINYRLIELHVLKSNVSKQNFSNVFSFADESSDIKQEPTKDSDVTIEEEEIDDEVDSDAFGSEEDGSEGEKDDEEDEELEESED